METVALNTDAANPALDAGTATLSSESDLGIDVDGDGSIEATPISVDARGESRDVDLPGVGGTPDLGAAEVQLDELPIPETPSLVVTTTADIADAFDGEISLREAIGFINDGTLTGTITFASGVGEAFENGGTIHLTSGGGAHR